MATLLSTILGLALASAGAIALFLGYDDRSPALVPAGAVGLGAAAILFGIALLIRETRKVGKSIEELSGRLMAEASRERELPPLPRLSRVAEERPAAAGAVATVAAGLETAEVSAPASGAAALAPPPPKDAEAQAKAVAPKGAHDAPSEEAVVAPPIARGAPSPVADQPADAPDATSPIDAEDRRRLHEIVEDSDPSAPQSEEAFSAAEPAPPLIEDEEPIVPPPPDIDKILSDIIARRNRELPRRPPLTSPAPMPPPPAPAAASSDPDAEAAAPVLPASGEAAAQAATSHASQPVEAESDRVELVDQNREESETALTRAAEPAPEPPIEAEPAAPPHEPAKPERKMIRSFSSGPNRYTMYDDGSIEAETPQGRLTFASFDELRRYIDDRMSTPRAAG